MNLNRKTIANDEDYLRQVSVPVDFKNDNFMEYVNALEKYCKNNAVYALAPVQIGIPKRMIYIKNTSQNMDNNNTDGYDEKYHLYKSHNYFCQGANKIFRRMR